MFVDDLKTFLVTVERFNDKYDGELIDKEMLDYIRQYLNDDDYSFDGYLADLKNGVNRVNNIDIDLFDFPNSDYCQGITGISSSLLHIHNLCVMFYKMLVMFDREIKYRTDFISKTEYDNYGEKMLARFEYNDYWNPNKNNSQNASVSDSSKDNELTDSETLHDETNNNETQTTTHSSNDNPQE